MKKFDGDPEKHIPAILYKYRDWNDPHNRRLVESNEVYFASPKSFNDPYDCRITDRFIKRSRKELDQYINTMAIEHFQDTERMGQNFEHVLKDFESRVFDTANYQKEQDEIHFKMQDDYFGVLSLTKRWNSILMWSHYSNFHQGFCVGIKGPSLLAIGRQRGKGGKVFYKTKYPDLPLRIVSKMSEEEMIERMFIETHTKAAHWRYEKEYRVTKNFFGLANIDRRDYLPEGSITEIILGISMPDNHKEEIKQLAKNKKIKIYQAKKVPFRFEIDREEINF